MCTYHFSKKKKFVEWNCVNDIAEIGGKKNLLQLVCGNAIVEIKERYKKKNTHILILSVFFFTETIWFVMFFYGKNTLRTDKDRFKCINSYSKVHAVNKNKKKYTDFKHIRIDSGILILILKCT